jgi:hypothetical protein
MGGESAGKNPAHKAVTDDSANNTAAFEEDGGGAWEERI